VRGHEPEVTGREAQSEEGVRALVVWTKSPAETRAVGVALARSLAGGATVSLEGVLGSGKTLLAQGICEGLGVDVRATSPSYSLQNVYRTATGRQVVHMDCFRLFNRSEYEELAVPELAEKDAIVIVEWGDRVIEALSRDTVRIQLEILGPEERRISIRVPPNVELDWKGSS
jgi:tRNA threonylcarbamoyladenosine biosynthesis protein TsaE